VGFDQSVGVNGGGGGFWRAAGYRGGRFFLDDFFDFGIYRGPFTVADLRCTFFS
jgi:hypothetical protein